jgi:SAM-dependent methyltransferase
MRITQQQETLAYFKKHALDWRNKATGNTRQARVNNIKQRNDYVLYVIKNRKKTRDALDIGCGSGELVHDMAKLGVRATGIDFAQEIIGIARKTAKHPSANFILGSIFDFDFGKTKYDVISANGFIEYISYAQLIKFLKISHGLLSPGGSLVVGSRNRLFNIFSLNDFTESEINDGTADKLLAESISIARGLSINKLAKINPVPLQKSDQRQDNKGVTVSVRYQYTPVQLIRLLKNNGFGPTHISPIHIHGAAPSFKDKYPDIHVAIANFLQNYAEENMSLIPSASSFMIHARKI